MKNLFKFLLLGAFTFSLAGGFVGCKNYDDDIAQICKDIELIQSEIEKLQEEIDNLPADVYISDITISADGRKITFEYSDGRASVEIMLPDGPSQDFNEMSIGEDGFWYLNDTKTAYKVYESPSIVDGFWAFPQIVDGEVTLVKSDIPAVADEVAIPYVIENTDKSVSLWIATEEDPTTLKEIKLPTLDYLVASEIGDIQIIGTIKGFDEKAPEISIGAMNIEVDAVGSTSVVNYAWIEKFQAEATSGVGETGGTVGTTGPAAWTGGNTQVQAKQVLTTSEVEKQGIIVSVTPSTADLSKIKNFQLVNSKDKDNVLPVTLGTPVKYSGLLTRGAQTSAAGSALYFIPFEYNDETYDAAAEYTVLFPGDALYSLVSGNTRYGSYNPAVTFIPKAVAATAEAAVISLINADEVAAAGTGVDDPNSWELEKGKPYTATFAAASNVVDYYFTIINESVSKPLFGVELTNNNTTITVNNIPDPITATSFKIGVYKLMVDGKIYYQESYLQAVHDEVKTTVDLGDYLIIDAAKTGISPWTGAPMTTIDLAGMFAQLRAQTWAGDVNLETYWKGDTGAATMTPSMTAKKANGDDDTAAAAALNPQTNVYAAANIKYFKANGTTAVTNLREAEKIVITPKYSPDGVAATLIPYDTYTVSFDIEDASGAHLNTLVVTFTPTLPDPSELVVKNINGKFWSADESTLLAYYPEPSTWDASSLSTTYDTNPATGNGGFISLGGKKGADTMWAAPFAFTVDPAQKIGSTPTLMTDIAKYPADNATITSSIGAQAKATSFAIAYQNSVEAYTAKPADGGGEEAKLPAGVADPYKEPINVLVDEDTTLYLGVYSYTETAPVFKIQLMSGLYEGTIEVAGDADALELEAVGDTPATIDSSMITGRKYNHDVTYSVFTTWTTTAEYKYTYIRKVVFSIPAGQGYEQTYLLKGRDATDSSDKTDATDVYEVAAKADGGDGNPADGYIQIVPVNSPSGVVNGKITVTVYDRFGKTKTQDLDVTIKFTPTPAP